MLLLFVVIINGSCYNCVHSISAPSAEGVNVMVECSGRVAGVLIGA